MTWNKIKIKQGQEIIAANNLEPIDRDIKILSILYGKPVHYYESIPKEDLYPLIAKTNWIQTLPQAKQTKPFYSGNYFYKFRTMPDQLSQSDFALLQKYSQSDVADLHKILAILSTKFRIVPSKKCTMDFEQRSELFLNKMPFGMAYSYCLFFSTYYPHLLDVGRAYSQGVQEAASQYLEKQTPS